MPRTRHAVLALLGLLALATAGAPAETGTFPVAMPVGVLWALAPRVKPAPGNYWLTGGDTGDAVERFLVGD
jgi:hypothetical protein